MATPSKEKAHKLSAVVVASQTARHLIRLAAEPRTEFDLYNAYMTEIGGFLPTPNPKGDVFRCLLALKSVGLLVERQGSFVATKEAIEQVRSIRADDLTADLVRGPNFQSLISEGMQALTAIACCSTSTSCNCSSSSSSTSVTIELSL